MNALSKLLAKVAIRAIAKSSNESELLSVGDKVIVWQPLMLEEHIEAIVMSMDEDLDNPGTNNAVDQDTEETVEPEETAQPNDDTTVDETVSEDATEPEETSDDDEIWPDIS